ncbi:MAG: single-stranded-DNA-specific exonuclease RecJ [Candidatus Caenarcaniphilales bacterium]|nr:single-stranded-DNA-specific exonuclease RecJ [Candidatus Caenarcaniphilales bacterium]
MLSKWELRNDSNVSSELIKLCKGDSLLARLLVNRGVNDPSLINYYLDIDHAKYSHSFEIPEMEKAFLRVKEAINNKERILIYGDYDVDGTSSVALLYRAFGLINYEVAYYVPNRHNEGYGVNKNAVKKIREEMNIDLMITCDCGISNFDEVAYANELQLDVIVTDHHSIPKNPPPSIANCNPKTLPEDHPLHYLPGVGVAFKLAELILNEFAPDKVSADKFITSLLDLVALGIIADLAPLKSENRLLCIKGLGVLSRTNKPGLQKLLNISGSADAPNTEHIGFGVAPRINAAGRLSDALNAVKLMTTDDYTEAEELSELLDSENQERQGLCERIFDEALMQIEETLNLKEEKVIVIGSKTWHHGVIGIVASRLVEKFHLPVFIMAIEKEVCKGSVRGIDIGDLDIFLEMQSMQEEHNIFHKYGGHMMAAGFSIMKENFNKFKNICSDHFKEKLKARDLSKVIKVDSDLFLKENSEALISRLENIAPYGLGHPQAVFATGPLKIKGTRILGKEKKHLKLYLEDTNNEAGRSPAFLKNIKNKTVEAVIWNRAQDFFADFHKLENDLYIAYTPKINDFRDEKFIQLDIKDWKSGSEINPEIFTRTKN